MTEPYTDADVELVENAWLDTPPCNHNVPTDYPEACAKCAARAVLSALAAAGRLTPADTEVHTERATGNWHKPIRRTVWVGPWLPDTEEGTDGR